jgi:UDP-N-acetylmuramoyl-tripeptide--D-alanyl-D-alanine ligase
VIEWDAARVAAAAGARLVDLGADPSSGGGDRDRGGSGTAATGPRGVTIDSRRVAPGDLFVGLPGERVDGGAYADQALAAGAWGVLVADEHAGFGPARPGGGACGPILAHPDPLSGLQSLARAWRRELGAAGARVVAVTGSTGKTSTKDILAALLRGGRGHTEIGRAEIGLRTVASPANLNTEIGLPLAVLAAPAGTQALVLELAMRGAGQIAQLTAIAQPDVGVIVNVGPVHLEQLGSLEAIAAAKAELIAGMAPGATIVVPADEPLLASHLRADLRTITFGEGGDVELVGRSSDGEVTIADRTAPGGAVAISLRPSFAQSHNLRNLLAAVAAARALGVTPGGSLDVRFSALRGERVALNDEIVLINDCYNANPMSMRAALDDLAGSAPARRVAVLGDMLELGPQQRRLHREVAAHAQARGVELLVAVGPLAAEMATDFGGEFHGVPDAAAAARLLAGVLRPRDTVLVKGSRGVGLELVAESLAEPPAQGRPARPAQPGQGR